MKKHLLWSAAAIVLTLAASVAQALPMPPGTILLPVAAEPAPTGVIIDSLAVPFAVPGSFAGTLYTDVISGDGTNPLGGLTFVYRVENLMGPNSIGRFSIDSYAGWAVDVSYVAPVGVAPAYADRNPFGDVLGFSFAPFPTDPLTGFLLPGMTSARLVVQTAATRYAGIIGSLIDGGVTTADSYGPTVPEPSTWALAAMGVVGALAAARRRR